VRQLPSAEVCFLGGACEAGGTKTLWALLRSRRPLCRRALACLRSRCLRAKAAEKELQTTTPLTTDSCVTAEVEATRLAPFKSRLGWLGRVRRRTVAIVIRVGRFMGKIAARWARNLEAGCTSHRGNDKSRRVAEEPTSEEAGVLTR
jgi:hypothetical protein